MTLARPLRHDRPGARRAWALALGCTCTGGLALAFGCDRAPSAPAPARAESEPRIVALGPAIARTLADAGHQDNLVGRHAFDLWTDDSIPVCGDQGGVDYEALLAARPTHVLLQWGRRELPPRLERLARQRGWIVRNDPLLSLDEVTASCDELWRMFEGSVGAPPSERMARALDGARIDPARVGRVLLLAGVRPPTALGPGSYHHDMLVRLGARPALERGAPYVTLDAEDLLRLAPEAIVLVQPRWGVASPPGSEPRLLSPDEARARLGRLGRLDLPALREGRVAVIDDPMAFVPGSNLVNVAAALRDQLEAWSR
ncbi:MAG: ABC transporter substrate-binding protein [Phycisphaerales bacterium]